MQLGEPVECTEECECGEGGPSEECGGLDTTERCAFEE